MGTFEDALVPSLWSRTVCEAQPLNAACWLSGTPVSCDRGGRLPREPSLAVGVHHPVKSAVCFNDFPPCLFGGIFEPEPSVAFAVGHPVKSLAEVRRLDPRSAQIGRPHFIGCSFQISLYSGEPLTSKRARNLFSKHD